MHEVIDHYVWCKRRFLPLSESVLVIADILVTSAAIIKARTWSRQQLDLLSEN